MVLSLVGRGFLLLAALLSDLADIVGFVQDREHKKLGDHTGKSDLCLSSVASKPLLGPWAEPRPKSEMLSVQSLSIDDYLLSVMQ